MLSQHTVLSLLGFAALLVGSCLFTYFYAQRRRAKFSALSDRLVDVGRACSLLEKEIAFYQQKKSDLTKRSQQRRQLATAARAMGACLDPVDIQAKLLASAEALFPNCSVAVSVGQQPDVVDRAVIQKGQPVLVPSHVIKGDPLMAVPVKAQGSVAGVLRVGTNTGVPFTPDDLRLLDILGSLASLSLENSVLFHQIQESALRDNLTGLWTHRAFQDHLEASLLEASRYNQPLSLILADIDHFKSVNDSHGHPAGDQVLQGFAHMLGRHVRDVDIVARYGGEEFTILLLQTPPEEAMRVAEAMRHDFESQRFGLPQGVLTATASFGVAAFPSDATSGQQLVRAADERLYAAKKSGRNRVIGKAA